MNLAIVDDWENAPLAPPPEIGATEWAPRSHRLKGPFSGPSPHAFEDWMRDS